MDALKQAGIRIPQDIAVIGFDNRLEGAVYEPGLTSLHVPLFNMGYRAVELLYQHLVEQIPLPDQIEVNTQLVIRQSCGCGSNPIYDPNSCVYVAGQSLAQQIAAQIQKQAYGLEESECLELSNQLVRAFFFRSARSLKTRKIFRLHFHMPYNVRQSVMMMPIFGKMQCLF